MAREPSLYPIETQARIVPALCALHNFIRIHDPDDLHAMEAGLDDESIDGVDDGETFGELGGGAGRAESRRAEQARDEIAQAMWEAYRNERRHRRH